MASVGLKKTSGSRIGGYAEFDDKKDRTGSSTPEGKLKAKNRAQRQQRKLTRRRQRGR